MTNNKSTKLNELYNHAKEFHGKSDLLSDDAFKVYVERMFDILYAQVPSPEQDVRYSLFKTVLNEWIDKKRDFNLVTFTREVDASFKKHPITQHTVYFGIRVKMAAGAVFPIKKVLNINDVTFELKSYKAISAIDDGEYIKELVDEYLKERYEKYFAEQVLGSEYVFFKAITRARFGSIAVNKVHTAFELFTASATIAQERFRTVHYWGLSGIENRKPIQNPFILYLDKSHPETNTYSSVGAHLMEPAQALDFTKSIDAVKRYKQYLHILAKANQTPIEERIKSYAIEFDKAMDTTDPHLRALGLWRCFEIATRMTGGSTRKEEDMIKILSTYYTNDYWTEQGNLIKKYRNSYVHEGETLFYQTRDYYLKWLQDYASAALSLLMWMRNSGIGMKVGSDIDDFFDMYPKSIDALKVAGKMLRARKV